MRAYALKMKDLPTIDSFGDGFKGPQALVGKHSPHGAGQSAERTCVLRGSLQGCRRLDSSDTSGATVGTVPSVRGLGIFFEQDAQFVKGHIVGSQDIARCGDSAMPHELCLLFQLPKLFALEGNRFIELLPAGILRGCHWSVGAGDASALEDQARRKGGIQQWGEISAFCR